MRSTSKINHLRENSHQNCSSALPAAGNTLAAGDPAGNTLPVVVAVAGSSPSAVPAGTGLAVARSLVAGSWDPEEDSNRLAGAGRREHRPAAREHRSRRRQPGEAEEAGRMGADLACWSPCCLGSDLCATDRRCCEVERLGVQQLTV